MKQIEVKEELSQVIITIDGEEILSLSVGESYALANRLIQTATDLESTYADWLAHRAING